MSLSPEPTVCEGDCDVCRERRERLTGKTAHQPGERRRIFVHIGHHKTGSTAIQYVLNDNRELLAKRGVCYPGWDFAHDAVAIALSDIHGASDGIIAQAVRIRKELAASSGDMVVSSEGFVGVDPRLLRSWCGDADAIVIVYLREQAEAFASQYQQQVKAGLTYETFEAFARPIIEDHNKFLAPWADAFGKENLRVRAYQSDVVADFMKIVGVEGEGLTMSQADPNPSVAGALLEAKRRINEIYPRGADELMSMTWGQLVDLASMNPGYRGRVRTHSSFIEAIRMRHRASNKQLAANYGVILEERPWIAPSYSEADVRTAFDALLMRSPHLAHFAPRVFPTSADAAYRRWRKISSGEVTADPLFRHALNASAGRSVAVLEKLQHLFLLIRDELGTLQSQHVVEFGCFRGGSALFMSYLLKHLYPHAKLYALDTFQGMPDTNPSLDAHGAGDYGNADLPGFRARLAELDLNNVVIVEGLVEDTFPRFASERFGLAHIDLDIYSGCKYAQNAVWQQLADRGWLVYDDANAPSCIGATRAAEEMMIEHRRHTEQVWPHWVFRKPLVQADAPLDLRAPEQ